MPLSIEQMQKFLISNESVCRELGFYNDDNFVNILNENLTKFDTQALVSGVDTGMKICMELVRKYSSITESKWDSREISFSDFHELDPNEKLSFIQVRATIANITTLATSYIGVNNMLGSNDHLKYQLTEDEVIKYSNTEETSEEVNLSMLKVLEGAFYDNSRTIDNLFHPNMRARNLVENPSEHVIDNYFLSETPENNLQMNSVLELDDDFSFEF